MIETISNNEEDILSRVQGFSARTERFDDLPPDLKKIAINNAVYALSIPDSDLLISAAEIDMHAIDNPFARYDKEVSGSLLDNHHKLRLRLLDTGRSYDVVEQISLRYLRISIASRRVREELVQALGHKPGSVAEELAEALGGYRYEPGSKRDYFQRANDLTWQAVREFQK